MSCFKSAKIKGAKIAIAAVFLIQVVNLAMGQEAIALPGQTSNQGNTLLPVIEMLEYVATAKRNNLSVEHRSKLSKAIDTLKQITR